MDTTAQKLNDRLEEIDRQMTNLRIERNAISTALSVAGLRPPAERRTIYTQEDEYWREQPFKRMSLTDSCLKVLRDHSDNQELHEQWLDKNQVEYLVRHGGFEFKTEHATNSVNVTLRRLAEDGYCEGHGGRGPRTIKYRFVKDRLPGPSL